MVEAGDGETVPGPRRRRLQVNPKALEVVPAEARKFWERIADDVELDIAQKFRKKWTIAETTRVVVASPDETYEGVAAELGRSPGAVRYRRQAMIHLIREEHGAPERVHAYRQDPKTNHKFHDYHQVHEVLEQLGVYDLPVAQQFALAQPLRQPSKGWRGDGSSAVLSAGRFGALRDEISRLLREARDDGDGDAGGT